MRVEDLVVKSAVSGNGTHGGFTDLIITVPLGYSIYAIKVTKRSMFISTRPFPSGYGQDRPLLGDLEKSID